MAAVYRMPVYNLTWKEDANMKKRMIAMALLIAMLFALSACGGSQQAAPAAQPAAAGDAAPAPADQSAEQPADQPADQSADQSAEQPAEQGGDSEVTAIATENAIPDGSGIVTFKSNLGGFSFDFDSDKYVAMENPVGNVDIFAGQDEGIPRCTVALRLKENTEDAVAYLKDLVEGVETEKGKNMVNKAGEPKKVAYGDRDIYYVAYTFKDKEAGGNVMSVYYAENLKGGDVAVYTSSALEGQTADVDAILQLAVQTFKFS